MNIVLLNKNMICVWNVWNIQWLIYSLLVFNATFIICLLFHGGQLFVDGEESWSARTELLTFDWETVKQATRVRHVGFEPWNKQWRNKLYQWHKLFFLSLYTVFVWSIVFVFLEYKLNIARRVKTNWRKQNGSWRHSLKEKKIVIKMLSSWGKFV